MEIADFLAATERDGAAFADAIASAGLSAPVAACPGWTAADLCWHLAEVHDFWRTIVGDHRDTWEGYQQPVRPPDDELVAFYREGLAATLAVLASADPQQPNWTWSNDHSAGFVIRRMAHETAVHSWDAQQAAGTEASIDATLASDGIAEFLRYFLDGREDAESVEGSVHIHCTDVAGEWTLRPAADGDRAFDVTPEHAKGDCALRGGASDLLLTLWRRVPLSRVDVVGDAAVAERFVAFSSLD